MILPRPPVPAAATLERRIGLRSAVLFNMLEMIGVGPFITLPLVIAAAGYRLSVWAWVLGAVIAVADGLVWAELGAAFPRAGGSYAFLREIYGPEARRQLAQLSLRLAVELLRAALHCLGLHRPLEFSGLVLAAARRRAHRRAARAALLQLCRRRRLPAGHRAALSQPQLHHAPGLGAVCRRHGGHRRRHRLRLCPRRGHGRLAHAAFARARPARWRSAAWRRPRCIATYDYWGYYNICFLGGEVRRPERTIPRAILLSVLFVSAFYVAMNLAALPSLARCRRARRRIAPPSACNWWPTSPRSAFGHWAGYTIAALIIWTAFASSSRCCSATRACPTPPPATATTSAFLPPCIPGTAFPTARWWRSAWWRMFFCFFSLAQVITMLVITRILLQFFLQQVGVILLRVQRPELPRPFRMPLYPLPPLVAMAGFVFILRQPQPCAGRAGRRRRHRRLRHGDLSCPRAAAGAMAVYAPRINVYLIASGDLESHFHRLDRRGRLFACGNPNIL